MATDQYCDLYAQRNPRRRTDHGERCARSPLLLALQLGQIVSAGLMPSGHCRFFRRINWTGKLHVLDDALAVELPNIFVAALTYTNREPTVGVHTDHPCARASETRRCELPDGTKISTRAFLRSEMR
jgi:hypothetical protein